MPIRLLLTCAMYRRQSSRWRPTPRRWPMRWIGIMKGHCRYVRIECESVSAAMMETGLATGLRPGDSEPQRAGSAPTGAPVPWAEPHPSDAPRSRPCAGPCNWGRNHVPCTEKRRCGSRRSPHSVLARNRRRAPRIPGRHAVPARRTREADDPMIGCARGGSPRAPTAPGTGNRPLSAHLFRITAPLSADSASREYRDRYPLLILGSGRCHAASRFSISSAETLSSS